MDTLINIREAARILGVSTKTLRNWDNDGKFVSIKTKGGHRRYLVSNIELFMKEKPMSNPQNLDPVVAALYEAEDPASGGLSGVSRAIKEVLEVLDSYHHDYGAQVRVFTKALMIINEKHRLFQNRKDELPPWERSAD